MAQGSEVWVAGERAQEQLLKTEFPELPFLQLPGYRIRYAKTRWGFVWKMIQQGPQMHRAIQYENHWLKKRVNEYKFDAVISDNRYGLYHADIPCIFITHQLTIKNSLGKWTEMVLQKRNYSYVNRFTECWVPDAEGENNIAEELSHPSIKPVVPVRYIGWLSRFEKKEIAVNEKHLLVILSGPEPQRTILEEKIIEDISQYNGTATVVRGLPGSPALIPSTNMIKFYNHLPSTELNREIQQAAYIISRSGYSTIMDIATLQKKSILIPTRGQTEQEYLAKHLSQKNLALCFTQKDFSLPTALLKASQYIYQKFPDDDHRKLKKTITGFIALATLKRK
jgi:uncharacterized protein (TIGR00661 family)